MLLPLLLCYCTVVVGQSEINWISFEEYEKKNKKEPRKLIIDLYADWCGWCKVMDKKTYSDSEIVDIINTNFYAVKMDVEDETAFIFGGKKYKYLEDVSQNGVNELALYLTNNRMSLPSTAFIDKKTKVISTIPGYIEKNKMFVLLNKLKNF